MRHNVLLVTGFEPWGEFNVNPSKDYVDAGPKFIGWQIVSRVLPVSKKCIQEFDRAIEVHDPAVIISLGLAANRSKIEIETRAKRGDKCELGTEILKSDLTPTDCNLSNDAGDFFCNDLFYYGLQRCHREGRSMSFVHVPQYVKFTDVDDVIRKLLAECRRSDKRRN